MRGLLSKYMCLQVSPCLHLGGRVVGTDRYAHILRVSGLYGHSWMDSFQRGVNPQPYGIFTTCQVLSRPLRKCKFV